MTKQEILESTENILTPGDVSEVINCDPQLIRIMARDCPEKLGFKVIRIGSRTKIPREAFVEAMGWSPGKEAST